MDAARQPFVAAFDLATATGVADGMAGARAPRFWSWELRDAGPGRPRRLELLMRFLRSYFREQQQAGQPVDAAFYESAMVIAAAAHMGSDEETQIFLRGAIGVFEACAAEASVPIITPVDVKDVRKHFIGVRTMPKGTKGKRGMSPAKAAVFERCQTFGWHVETDNESDACALWSYGCSTMNPRLAHLVTPLFAGR